MAPFEIEAPNARSRFMTRCVVIGLICIWPWVPCTRSIEKKNIYRYSFWEEMLLELDGEINERRTAISSERKEKRKRKKKEIIDGEES